ncbi:hypothetical protein IGK08_002831 [Enterococcus sp. DIV1286c]|jgi:hypothetical protein|uniref:hypothetical protein n=1 Tax=Enterococcus TaxID=1350 RepID=UPI0008267D30|nr:hypothetical protein [Enterococcus mundtii]AZP91632.1 hypothetical protein CYK55_00120 [Enterococcus mundtii]QCJ57879.1 hypothetical protein DDJ96_14895 [Enterococcus mundtii]
MSEIEKLLSFMDSGRRKKILLADYFELQEQKGTWNNKRSIDLRREISGSPYFEVTYIKKRVDIDSWKTETLLKIKPKYTCKRNRSL